MNDRKALILAMLIERGRLKEAEIVKITGIPRSPVRRGLRGLGSFVYRDEGGYWHVQERPKVAVLRSRRFGFFQWLERHRRVREAKDLARAELWVETIRAWEDQREPPGVSWLVDRLNEHLADVYGEGEDKSESPQ